MKIKIISVLVILVMIISIICGCQAPVTTGTVVDKSYRPARTETRLETIDQGSFSTTIPITEHYPESWHIVIEGYDENNEYHQTSYNISEEEYNSINIGDTYIHQED